MGKNINFIKRPVINVLYFYLKWKREWMWCRQAFYWRNVLLPKETIKIDVGSSYLVLAPHADDEWIGCSQIIRTCKNVIILNMDMPGGDSKELHSERLKELSVLAKRYNRKLLSVGENKPESLAEIIATENPDYLCLPHFFDWHPEHIQVIRYLRRALKQVSYNGKIMMYQVSLPMHPDFVNCSVPINKAVFKEKWWTFEELYKTQIKIAYHRFMANERINGALSNSYAAEVYSIKEVNMWLCDFENFRLTSKEIEEVRANLNDITKTRKLVIDFLTYKTSIKY